MAKVKPDGRYCILLRKSRADVEAEARGQFETLAYHEAALKSLAENLGIKVSKIYRELVSGDRLDDRPETMQLIKEVMRGEWDGVLANDIQRISRGDMIDQGTIINAFRYSDTLIITPGKVFDLANEYDAESVEHSMRAGRVELGFIKKRFVEGKERRSEHGEYLGSIAPFGWEKCVVDRKKTLRPGRDHDVLYQIYLDLASWTRCPTAIADDFNRAGFLTPRGKHWDAKTVCSIARNPANIGYIRWNQRKVAVVFDDDMKRRKVRKPCDEAILVEGLHRGLGLIDDELFYAANRQLDLHSSTKEHSGKPLQNPLAGLLVCAKCGRAMARSILPGERTSGGRKKKNWYTHPKSNRYECHVTSAKMETVVDAVVDALCAIVQDIEVSLEDSDPVSEKAARARASVLRKSISEERRVTDNLFRLVERGMISDEEFAERKAMSGKRLAALEEQLAQAEDRQNSGERMAAKVLPLKEAIAGLKNFHGRAKEVNDVLKMVVARIEYDKDPQTKELHLGVFLVD